MSVDCGGDKGMAVIDGVYRKFFESCVSQSGLSLSLHSYTFYHKHFFFLEFVKDFLKESDCGF